MTLFLLVLVTLVLAAANGANDNIKGAATLLGSGLVDYRRAIALATLATAVGGLASVFLANGLLAAFSGRGIVPDEVAASLSFLGSVAFAAAATVWLATRLGLPISTTHALLGGLLGAGFAAAPEAVSLATALRAMLLPLLLSPAIALGLALGVVPLVRRWQTRAAALPDCVCVEPALPALDGVSTAARAIVLDHADTPDCAPLAGRQVHRYAPTRVLDRVHFLSAAAVSFARGLNDTPKIAALIVAGGGLGAGGASVAVVLAMALGGWLAARRVADTLAFRVTRMDPAEGLAGNVVTAALVIVASRFGLPISTTHVSTGALFGIAAGNRSGQGAVVFNILAAWLVTLPLAALFAWLGFRIVSLW